MAKKKPAKQSPFKKAADKPVASIKISQPVVRKKSAGGMRNIDYYAIALGVVLFIVALVRFRLLAIPFERDEGEYAYIGNLILHGGMPYHDVYNMKLPGTYGMYSIIIYIFGNSPTGIHTGLMFTSLATIILLYLAFKKMFTPMVGLITATVYSMLSISLPFIGFAAHATHFINFYVALALFFYARYNEKEKWWDAALTGFLFGMAFLMKQQAVFFMVFGGVMIVVREWLNKPLQFKKLLVNGVVYSLAALLPYLSVIVVMKATHNFDKFWFWTIQYARGYASAINSWDEITYLFSFSFKPMFNEYPLIWIMALIGMLIVWFSKYDTWLKITVVTFAILSFAAVCPGLYFRNHYFIVLIPAVGLLTAITLEVLVGLIPNSSNNMAIKSLPFALVFLMWLISITSNRDYYMDKEVDQISKGYFGTNPFIEAPKIGKYLASHTSDTDKIGVLGSEPEVLVYANRRSVTGYIYMYPLMEIQASNAKMQHELISDFETHKPKYIVYYNMSLSWLREPNSPPDIYDWWDKYGPANYDQVGLIDISQTGGPSKYYWEKDAERQPAGNNFIRILKRKEVPNQPS